MDKRAWASDPREFHTLFPFSIILSSAVCLRLSFRSSFSLLYSALSFFFLRLRFIPSNFSTPLPGAFYHHPITSPRFIIESQKGKLGRIVHSPTNHQIDYSVLCFSSANALFRLDLFILLIRIVELYSTVSSNEFRE